MFVASKLKIKELSPDAGNNAGDLARNRKQQPFLSAVKTGPNRNAGHDSDGNDDGFESDTGTLTKTKPKTKKPSMYKVLLLNDDYTPMEFVVYILESIFNKGQEDAVTIMLHVHQKGVGVCGVYPYEIAETKVAQVMDLARKEQHPLQCTLEKD